ncbi:hypothetical protein HNY73_005127 [Argiope bruennichi]|uniref:Thyroglobulin type-1 domain-containing protein n=1 Tax=Argiope bruennichi TaxID=94029 RepID=A0A8T0FMN2_ARGBR|nr:hypothetical protein HNY73_005127 [Argiope bruennichi]
MNDDKYVDVLKDQLLCSVPVSASDLQKFRCYDGFCKAVACESITNCSKGRIIPNASYCGCCDACIKILEENEECDEHLMGSLRDIKAPRCKDGLKCINGKCTQDDNVKGPCLLLLNLMKEKRTEEDFADDLWLPECDENGGFKAKQIKKRKALCYNRQGEKLYGQEEPEFASNMTCGCSRHLDNLRKENPISFNTMPQEHCTETGDFERMQCIGDLCFCASPVTGEVNSRVVKTAYISRLPCYDKKPHGKGILKECEKELQRTRFLRFYFFQKGLEIFGLETLRCDFDGTFASRQCDSTECRCTDERGISIKSYYIGLKDYENLQREMTCDCARDVETVASHRQYPALKCESFGNYRRLQCFEDDQCFCVDEDGDIISRLWNKTELQDEHCADILKYLYLLS